MPPKHKAPIMEAKNPDLSDDEEPIVVPPIPVIPAAPAIPVILPGVVQQAAPAHPVFAAPQVQLAFPVRRCG